MQLCQYYQKCDALDDENDNIDEQKKTQNRCHLKTYGKQLTK